MADITEYLEQIENAVYGKDVRQAIHDGIEQCYADGKAGAIDLTARNAIKQTENEIAVERARIDNIASLDEGSTTGDAELVDIRIGSDGVTYASAGEAVRSQIENLNYDVKRNGRYNCINLIDYNHLNKKVSTTSGGATYTWVDNFNNCIITASPTTGQSTYNFYNDQNQLPTGIEAGKTYNLFYCTTDSNVVFLIAFYANGESLGSTAYEGNAVIEVPSNANGMLMRLRISSGKTVNATVEYPRILTTYTNNDLTAIAKRLENFETSLNITIDIVNENNGSIRNDGSVDNTYEDTCGYSNKIPCTPGCIVKYKLRGYGGRYVIAFYKFDDTFLTDSSIAGGSDYMAGTLTIPEGALYMRCSCIYSYMKNCYIAYEPKPAVIAKMINDIDEIQKVTATIPEHAFYGLKSKLFYKPGIKFLLHRGAQTEAPENTIPAFTIAGQKHAWGIETDIWQSTDGDFFCFHDETVDRMTDGTGTIAQMTTAQIEALTIDSGAHIADYSNLKIPRLEAYLKVCRLYDCVPLIEIKDSSLNFTNLMTIIKKYGFEESAILLGNRGNVRSIRRESKSIMFFALVGDTVNLSETAQYLIESGYDNLGIDIDYRNLGLTEAFVTEQHLNNLVIGTYTVNTREDAVALYNMAIDCITTNSLYSID